MLKVGMVGVGCISGIYLKNFHETFKNVKLVAVCDLIKERAEKAKEEYNIPKIYDTMYELFADDEIDIVLNLTRPYEHYEVSKAALLAGKHVYSEKPLGATFEEGTELVKLAEEKGLWIGGAPDTFMGAGIQTCRKFIDEDNVGEIVGGRCIMANHGVEGWHPDPDFYYQFGGGPLLDMGPYYITALVNLIGEVKSVFGVAKTTFEERLITSQPHNGDIIKVEVPTHYEAILNFTNGAVVSLLMSFDVHSYDHPSIHIYGTKGNLIVPDPNCFADQNGMSFTDGESKNSNVLKLEFGYSENSRCLGLADLAAAIEQGRTPRASYLQTYHVLEVMTGIMKSAETGKLYEMSTRFKREAPMEPSLPTGVL